MQLHLSKVNSELASLEGNRSRVKGFVCRSETCYSRGWERRGGDRRRRAGRGGEGVGRALQTSS